MSELKDLIQVMQQQMTMMQQQHKEERQQHKEEKAMMIQQRREDQERMDALMKLVQHGSGAGATGTAAPASTATPTFSPFDSASELWADYYARFCTFVGAHSVPDQRKAQVFLTNQTPTIYKLLSNLAAQQTPPIQINDLSMADIVTHMKDQFDPKRFIVRERYKFWSDMRRRPGETIQELAARIRQDAATCDFPSIKDPQDEALRTRFICSVNNEAILKALFKLKDEDLTFTRAIEIASETEDAAKVAKETVHGPKPNPVHKLKPSGAPRNKEAEPKKQTTSNQKPSQMCFRCGNPNHKAPNCRFKDSTCNFCGVKGHLQKVCRKQQQAAPDDKPKKQVRTLHALQANADSMPKLEVPLKIQNSLLLMEIDTATTGNFISKRYWEELGSPKLEVPACQYESASQHNLPVLGSFTAKASTPDSADQHEIRLSVTEVPDLNLLGRSATKLLGISVDEVLQTTEQCNAIFKNKKVDTKLRDQCRSLCDEFPNLWKPELGCLKDFELEVKFKTNAQPTFKKARQVPFAIEESLNDAYDEGISKGIWEPVQFNAYGTPVVPVKKTLLPGQQKPKIRVCGDYSVTVNNQLEEHRHPLPLPEDLMHKLGGSYCFTKIDLADAYNQVKLAPASQKRLALSTHRGVLLQMRLPFGIKSAPGYFQEIMDNLTKDLPGTTAYLDDILVSGKDAEDHLHNLRLLLKRLDEKGLRCRLEKCQFAQPVVEYLGHQLSQEGIAKGPKVDDVLKMQPPTNVSTLKAFLGSVQFYAKFMPSNLATLAEPLYRLTKKHIQWDWQPEQQQAFEMLKGHLSSNNVLAHFDKRMPIGISCDASNVGIGAVLFHRYPDGSERPIANVSKTLTDCQRNYSQIQKEALAIIFGLKKFYQFVYGRKFILVTDHRPLLAIFGPNKETPALAANRLARWALLLHQFDYTIEYRTTAKHANADALSRLPANTDSQFDGEESEDDIEMVCAITSLSEKVTPKDQTSLKRLTSQDPVLSLVIRFTREGWPAKKDDEGSEMQRYRQLADSLTICNGCLLLGNRVVIPASMRRQILEHLHLGHFGMQKMKQLARTAVYWPRMDDDIEATCRQCVPCGEHQNKPPKPAIHPWMLPEKPWSRLHLDHAINFLGTNWLLLTDAYSKYPCIHPTQSVSAKSTIDLLEQDFAHFGYPHTLVTDNASAFLSDEFQNWCNEHGITHLTGPPYHPATNGSAERLVQTFKQALRKSSLPPRKALQQFLMQFRRTPTSSGYSPSELLNSRQMRTKIDILLPSPPHIAQGKQSKLANKSNGATETVTVAKVDNTFNVGDAVYALYFGPRRDKDARWVPAIITKRKGTRTFNVRVLPKGPTWRRHLEQLQPRHASPEDGEPGDQPQPETPDATEQSDGHQSAPTSPGHQEQHQAPASTEQLQPPRRSSRPRKPPQRFTPSR